MKKRKNGIVIVVIVAIVLMLLYMIGDDDEEDDFYNVENSTTNEASSANVVDSTTTNILDESVKSTYGKDDTWAIYWYLCGSDLESYYGAATEDLEEMLDANTLPDNIKVVIEAGGTTEWQNETMNANYLERYLYDSDGLTLLSQEPSASMGKPSTLQDFLTFCKENYEADHKMMIFWNHGGGSVSGVSFDEAYDYDSLTLDELYKAFDNTYELNESNPPFELVGFDACLMATVDTAYTFCDVARYMVASEEVEPGNGWYYTDWLNDLIENPGMNGAELGKSICDSYMYGCEMEWTDDEATLSVVNLQAASNLFTAYNNLGVEALRYAYDDPIYFTDFSRKATKAVNYGGNTKSEGYTNMIDLGDMVKQAKELLPKSAEAVLDAINQCVVYKVSGDCRSDATGLSCYYSFDGDTDNFDEYTQIASCEPFVYFYQYELYGYMDEGGYAYLTEDQSEVPIRSVPTYADEEAEDLPVYVDEDGYAVLEVDTDTLEIMSSISFTLAYIDDEEDLILYLGVDNDIDADWENGIFRDNFRGVWGSIDENLVYMELTEEGEDYNIYSVPILLNGEECNLRVYYDFNDATYTILGARRMIDETSGMSDKNLILLKTGDTITTRMYASTISGEDDPELYEIDTFTVREDTTFAETDLGDGSFLMLFELTDARNNSLYSDAIWFDVADGEITVDTDFE